MRATYPQVTEGERRRRREVTSPKSQCMEGTSSRNSWRGLSDTHSHPSRFLLSSKPVSITLRIKCQFPWLAFGAGPERDSGNLSGLIWSPKCVYYHLSPCLCPSRAPSAYNYIPSSPIVTSGLPHDGPSPVQASWTRSWASSRPRVCWGRHFPPPPHWEVPPIV